MDVVHLLLPAAVIAALGVFATAESEGARNASPAEQEAIADLDAFDDPAVIELARRTAYLDTTRTRAPIVTATLTDAEVVALGEQVCTELKSGITASDLSILHAYADAPRAEPPAIIAAAHATYCPDAWVAW